MNRNTGAAIAAVPRRYLIVGTDTGVGKTVVAAALARGLVASGHHVLAVKPVESGCGPTPGPEEDGCRLAVATGQARPRHALVRLRAPLAPPLAADDERVTLSPSNWWDEIAGAIDGQDALIVEGAGGLMSPLTWSSTALDLADGMGEPTVILVARDALGTLSHIRSAERILAERGASALIVLNRFGAADASTGRNSAALRSMAFARPVLEWSEGDRALSDWILRCG